MSSYFRGGVNDVREISSIQRHHSNTIILGTQRLNIYFFISRLHINVITEDVIEKIMIKNNIILLYNYNITVPATRSIFRWCCHGLFLCNMIIK